MTITSTATAGSVPLSREKAGGLFGQTMGLVALTAAVFALGAYVGRDTSGLTGIVCFLLAFGVLLAMNAAALRSVQLAVGLLFGFGLLMGLASRTYHPLLPRRRSAGGLAGGRGDGAVHRRIRRCRVRNAARSLGTRALTVLGAHRGDRLRDRARVRSDPRRRGHLRGRRTRDLRRADGFRLPAAAPHPGHPHRAAPRGVDLPRCAQCVPLVSVVLGSRWVAAARVGSVASTAD